MNFSKGRDDQAALRAVDRQAFGGGLGGEMAVEVLGWSEASVQEKTTGITARAVVG